MANTPSAVKRIRQAEASRLRNKSIRSHVRSAVKKVHVALERGETENVQDLLREATKKIDKAHSKGVLKANTASRKVGRLTKAVQKATAAS